MEQVNVAFNMNSITQSDEKSKHRDMLYVCADYPYTTLVCLLFSTAVPILHFSILSNCFCSYITYYNYKKEKLKTLYYYCTWGEPAE